MHARVPVELKEPLAREIRRIRLRSAFRLFIPAVALGSVILYLGIAWKGHALLSLLFQLLGQQISESKLVAYYAYGSVGVATLGVLLFFRHLIRKELYQDYLYCRRCDAFDCDETGQCPCCRAPLKEKQSFFYLEFDDERKTLEAFGLKDTRKEPDADPA